MKELTETEKRITDETRELLASLDEKQKELTEYQSNIVNIKKYASDLQAYLGVKKIEKDIATHDTCLQSNRTMPFYHLEVKSILRYFSH
jgi:predicted RNase H-like nuclease (RuvC/YqgF family)